MGSTIAGLVGVWRGGGEGWFPSVDPFAYEEEMSFYDPGAGALVYRLRAWIPETEDLKHVETGVWVPTGPETLAVTVSLPWVVEVSEGSVAGGRIELEASSVAWAAGGEGLTRTKRTYVLDGGALSYEIHIATRNSPDLARHLVGEVRRVE